MEQKFTNEYETINAQQLTTMLTMKKKTPSNKEDDYVAEKTSTGKIDIDDIVSVFQLKQFFSFSNF